MSDDEGTLPPLSPEDPRGPPGGLVPGVLAVQPVEQQLLQAKDHRWQRWFFYGLLTAFSCAFFGLFFYVVARAACHALDWSSSTDPAEAAAQLSALGTAMSKFPPATSAVLAAIIASVVAIPLSLCVALGKLVKTDSEATNGDTTSFTSALFELGRAFAQGWKSFKN